MNELELQSHAGASLWHNNPTLVHLLGLSPLLAISDRATTALAMGIGITLCVSFPHSPVICLQREFRDDGASFGTAYCWQPTPVVFH